MEKTDLSGEPCGAARALDRVGSWWTILILRDCFYGMTRFDEFQKSLKISTNSLASRLAALVDEGLLEKRQYSERPPRFEYILTQRGRDFRPVLRTLVAWGNQHFAPEGPAMQLTDMETGKPVELQLIDANTGVPITEQRHRMMEGPAATDEIRARVRRQHAMLDAQAAQASQENPGEQA